MEVYEVEILESRAKNLLNQMANLNLIKLQKIEKSDKTPRNFGRMKELVTGIADDFDAPLDDFKEYM